MRSLKDNQSLTPVLVNADYPNGAIINETPSVSGTAVVNEVYNDILVNIFKIINVTGTATNGIADSEATSYQFLAALQKFTNTLNDVEHVLTLSGLVFTLNENITLLPNKYFIFAKAVGAYNPAATYTFKGSTSSPSYSFISPTGFNDGDELLLILNQSQVRAYSQGGGTAASSFLTFTAGDLLGSDPFFFLPLSSTIIPTRPKYLTMYIEKGDGDNQDKMIQPVPYVATSRIITGMPNPTDFPDQIIRLFFA